MCPRNVLKGKIPKKTLNSKKPQVLQFHVFGFHVNIHVPNNKRTKFGPSSIKSIFVDYSENSKAYQMYISVQ